MHGAGLCFNSVHGAGLCFGRACTCAGVANEILKPHLGASSRMLSTAAARTTTAFMAQAVHVH